MYPNSYDFQPGYRAPAQPVADAGAMTRVYQWMALGLGLTGAVALFLQNQPALLQAIFLSPIKWVLLFAVVGLSVALQGFAQRMSAPVAFGVFFAYSALMGVALTPVFLLYSLGSVATTFFVTGGTFAAMTLWGYATKRDLAGLGSFLMMGLLGLIIATIVNVFVASSMLYWLTTYVGVIVFVGLVAFDTQRIKRMMAEAAGPSGVAPSQLAIQGATMLYLDFINLFVYLLRIFGRSRED